MTRCPRSFSCRPMASPEEPLSLDALVYPYPEMAYFDTGYTEEDLAFGESVAVLPLSREDRGQIEQLLDLYREESGLPDGDSRLIRLSIQDQLRALYGTARPVAPLFPTPLCGQIFLYIGQHSLKSLTAASVAERFRLTPVQLNRELRRVCLEGFGAVLRHAQVCNACTCLLRSNVTGTMLAKFAGFKSESALYRDFLKLRSATPQQYRQKILRDETSISRLINDQLSEIQVYVMENFQSPITCDSCAQELFLTKSVINRLLGEQCGPDVTFHKYLSRIRMHFAAGLLAVSDLPVCDVALEAGFHSVHTFIRLFKSEYGETPTQYRDRKKEGCP